MQRRAQMALLDRPVARAAAFSLSLFLCGCGGGSSGSGASSSNPPTPPPPAFFDPAVYSSAATASLAAANELASITHHQIVVNGVALTYTATAGHLTAPDPKT